MSDMTMWRAIGDLPHTLYYQDINGWRTRILEVGEGENTVVMLAGTSGHMEAFCHNIRALAEDHRVVCYDYPGHGWTTLATEKMEIPLYEDHLNALLDHLKLEKAILCGESLGGWIAIKFAQNFPDRVRALILSAPGGKMLPPGAMDRARSVSLRAVEEPTFDNVKERLQVVIHDKELITDELVESRRAIYARPGFLESMKSIMALQEPEIRQRNSVTEDDYAALSQPTLLVWTDHEPSGAVDVGEKLASLIPDGELLVIEGAAHWPQWEDPEKFNKTAVDFLKRKA